MYGAVTPRLFWLNLIFPRPNSLSVLLSALLMIYLQPPCSCPSLSSLSSFSRSATWWILASSLFCWLGHWIKTQYLPVYFGLNLLFLSAPSCTNIHLIFPSCIVVGWKQMCGLDQSSLALLGPEAEASGASGAPGPVWAVKLSLTPVYEHECDMNGWIHACDLKWLRSKVTSKVWHGCRWLSVYQYKNPVELGHWCLGARETRQSHSELLQVLIILDV